ncbi:hypothetical protein ACFWOJ_32095 [Streptomyces sp. NPDC058439]|uniref:hypothetical protein n=1 Tax=Streptomyces sp. NPDC058439 TaxID=3346500 RepID=UPI003667E58E
MGLALAGRAGARLAEVFGVSVGRSTVLRLVDALPEREVPAPRVVGVDEYATRKGRHYGTVLVNIDTRFPADPLPDREASSLAAGADWTVRVWDVARGQAMGRRSPDTQEASRPSPSPACTVGWCSSPVAATTPSPPGT